MADDRTVGQLVVAVKRDVTALVRSEVALAKAELKDDVKAGGVGAGLFGGAAFLGLVAFLFLLVGGALALALVLPEWAAFLVVGGALLLLAGVLALVGKASLSKVSKPERTIATAQESVQALKGVR
ncbi:phage holin family protein [Pseudokineococcus sp. 1T1Z-3]|uniref:phage holin family protein n=1 Tax=Pseudokineococcus sp. 1T1Z-3 TaxID=3132745 RepID=UPI0030AC7C7A